MENENIFRLLDKSDTPIKIKKLLNQFIDDLNSQQSSAWKREVQQTDSNYHRDILLDNGRVDISSKWNKNEYELSSNELICLFNYYYFPILFECSFSIFQKIWDSDFEHYFTKNNTLIFFDLGCSTLPSSLAFSEICDRNNKRNCIWKERELLKNYFINSYIFFDNYNISSLYVKDFLEKHTGIRQDELNTIPKFFNHSFEPIYLTNYYPCTDVFVQESVYEFTDTGGFKIEFPLIDVFEKYNSKAFELRNSMDGFFPFNKYILKYNENISIIINITELRFFDYDVNELIKAVNKIFTDYPNANLSIIYQSFSDKQIDYKWDYFKATLNLKMIKKEDFDLLIDCSKRVKYEILFASKYKDIVE